ncbi:MAG: hypothetical protein WKF80_08305 [Thermomicrobiales bacterium]
MDTRTRGDQGTGTRATAPGTIHHSNDLPLAECMAGATGSDDRDPGIPPHRAERADLTRRATDRRRLLRGAVGAGLAVTMAAGLARAQDAGTPAAEDSTDDADETGTTTGDVANRERVQPLIDRASLALDTVQTDIDSVTGQADTAAGETVSEGTALRDTAQAALDGDEPVRAIRVAGAALAIAKAADSQLRASLGFAGLPSQEVRSSRVLARVFKTIERVGVALTEAGDATATASGATPASTDAGMTAAADGSADPVEADRFLVLAQGAYGEAFGLHAAGAYQQAILNASAAVRMAMAATALGLGGQGDGRGGRLVGRIRDRRGGGGGDLGGGMGNLDETGDDGMDDNDLGENTGEPVTVPEPTFT